LLCYALAQPLHVAFATTALTGPPSFIGWEDICHWDVPAEHAPRNSRKSRLLIVGSIGLIFRYIPGLHGFGIEHEISVPPHDDV
jgi:hypothetical protein